VTATENHPANDTITFLGTGGARFMITTQLLASGGLWFNIEGTNFLVDPGPGCIVQTTKRKLNSEKLSGIIVSHRHLDHAADVNIMVEAMTRGGFRRHGRLFAPEDALENEPVIFHNFRGRLDGIEVLKAGGTYTIGNVSFSTPVRHIHGVETYGLVFKTNRYTIAYITDTRYFDDLKKYYAGDLLLLNVVFAEPIDNTDYATRAQDANLTGPETEQIMREIKPQIDHLSVPDAERLIREIKPKVAIMTHFGMGMWRAKPWEIAEQLTEKTGIKVIAARDGMTFDLSKLREA
jgi:ribonuclease BN (tRNA processing enzyme)